MAVAAATSNATWARIASAALVGVVALVAMKVSLVSLAAMRSVRHVAAQPTVDASARSQLRAAQSRFELIEHELEAIRGDIDQAARATADLGEDRDALEAMLERTEPAMTQLADLKNHVLYLDDTVARLDPRVRAQP